MSKKKSWDPQSRNLIVTFLETWQFRGRCFPVFPGSPKNVGLASRCVLFLIVRTESHQRLNIALEGYRLESLFRFADGLSIGKRTLKNLKRPPSRPTTPTTHHDGKSGLLYIWRGSSIVPDRCSDYFVCGSDMVDSQIEILFRIFFGHPPDYACSISPQVCWR